MIWKTMGFASKKCAKNGMKNVLNLNGSWQAPAGLCRWIKSTLVFADSVLHTKRANYMGLNR